MSKKLKKLFPSREKRLDYLDYVIRIQKEKSGWSGLSITFILGVISGLTLLLLEILSEYGISKLVSDFSLSFLALLITISTIIFSSIFKKLSSHLDLFQIIKYYFLPTSMLIISLFLYIIFFIICGNNHISAVYKYGFYANFMINMIIYILHFTEPKTKKLLHKIIIIILNIVRIYFALHILYAFIELASTSYKENLAMLEFSTIIFTYSIFISLFIKSLIDRDKLNTLESVRHDYTRGKIKFSEALLIVDLITVSANNEDIKTNSRILSKMDDKKENDDNVKLQIPKKRK